MTLNQALTNLIEGKLTQEVYERLTKYLTAFLFRYNMLPHLTVEDIIVVAITNAYNRREQYDATKSQMHSWLCNIAKYEVMMQDTYQNKRKMRIPTTAYINNTISTDEGTNLNIFEGLNLQDETSFDMFFNDSEDISELLRIYISENNFKLLEEFVYNKMSYVDIAAKYDIPIHKVRNDCYHSRLKCLKYFTGKSEFDKEYKSKTVYKKILSYEQKENMKKYNKKNEEQQKEYRKEYYAKKALEKKNK